MAVPTITNPGGQTGHIDDVMTPLVIVASEKPILAWKLEKPLPAGLSGTQVGDNYEITGTPTTKETVTVGLKAENAEGASAEATFEWKVKEDFPIIEKPADQTSHIGIAITPVTLVLTDGTSTSFAATGLPKGLSIKADTGVISGTPDTVKAAVTVEVKCVAPDGTNSPIVPFEWTVAIDVPVVTKPADRANYIGEAVSLAVVASGSPTLYAATGLPAGLSINTTTGVISGSPAAVKAAVTVKLKATNAGGDSAEVSFKWQIGQGDAEYNALAAKTPGSTWAVPDLWPQLHG
jgi:hypothetical protein